MSGFFGRESVSGVFGSASLSRQNAINLPSALSLTEEQIAFVVDHLRALFKR